MLSFSKKSIFISAILSCLFATFSAQASVIILGTRLIYPGNQSSLNVQLNNQDSSPALVQSWIEDKQGSQAQVPFIITPPVTRVEGNQGQTLRITFTGTQALPQDRESLYYFNLLDIPPKPSKAYLKDNPNYLQFSVRSRLKLFYRPSNLPYPPAEAYKKVTWLAKGGKLWADNPTPYYLTFTQATVGGKSAPEAVMVAPFSQGEFDVKGVNNGQKVKWSLINDYGGDVAGESTIN
ncbi:TPA: fimbria/pilus periplasmic chaperone [Haemophilus influenzae]|uniref:fimbria/pilus periplasmic chaperone n=1 Tax=Haemophilus TaxID=724 RepID=UPI000392BBD0|nr:fimbria/pilus periplasmic chaperone [Haemophilus influenzae]AGV11811.1 fimbrial chaperone [Haemophilus influenzae KR494]KPH72492.1 molecular chaperone [Haemophilus influenzae]MCK8820521.1 fimbria/pilus periplasmic chaperone [Haemophilus influenzae]MCK8880314.1 fimbria/pilus periplasmic chaperone [Haemophilus influenzae]MDF3119083.1 fimbria/pilus periplasmic chaperone [Haemophilus influenzae]